MGVRRQFPDLFGARTINGRAIDVDETIAELVRDLRGPIAAALAARRALLDSRAPVRDKYGWPAWEETFEDPLAGRAGEAGRAGRAGGAGRERWTFREIVQGLIDNGLRRDTPLRWRLNADVPVPKDAHPLDNPGLELTGPWHPL
ncbi:MAG TPA: hypothetical protein VEU08_19715, partial [Vicinamibacterales bacterium]|nr:hypothetical protein [Vicinamibacterales bacterium]